MKWGSTKQNSCNLIKQLARKDHFKYRVYVRNGS